MSGIVEHLVLLSRPATSGLHLPAEDLTHINPKHLMVVQAFLAMLTREEVIARLQQATSVSDLKALLVADALLTQIGDPGDREQLSDLLRSPEVGLDVVVRRLALALAREAYSTMPDEPGETSVLYRVETAAEEVGVAAEELYRDIGRGRIEAVLCLPLSEVERLSTMADRRYSARQKR